MSLFRASATASFIAAALIACRLLADPRPAGLAPSAWFAPLASGEEAEAEFFALVARPARCAP